MDNIIDTQKVNRSLFAYRVVDVHNDEFGFAQNGVIYTYATDDTANSKGTTWLRMQKTGESGRDRKKYFLFFGDETEHSAYVDKHNDIYDLEGNYVASLVNSKFVLFLFLFIAVIVLLTGLAMYLGGSVIMDTSTPFSQDKTIHIEGTDSTDGSGQSDQKMDILSNPSGKLESDVEGGGIKIYPGYQGEFIFYVKNDGDTPLTYQISFAEENTYNIPMRYKLMVDGQYYAGNENKWVDVSEFNVQRQAIATGDVVEFKIIYEWEDENTEDSNKRDTEIGTMDLAEYIIHATVYFEDIL